MRYRVLALLCILAVVALIGGAAPVSAQSGAETPQVHLEAQLEDDGDARWTVVISLPLEDADEVESFEAFAAEFEAGEEDVEFGVDAFERAATEAEAASGREMSLHSVSRDSVVVDEAADSEAATARGELRVSFTWHSFARLDENGTLYVDDAFNTTDGTWLSGLDEGQSLTIKAPPGYGSPTTSPAAPTGGDLHWEGPQTFETGYFEIVYHPTTSDTGSDLGVSTMLLVGALTLSAAALLLGLYLLWRRGDPESVPTDGQGVNSSIDGEKPTAPNLKASGVGSDGISEPDEADEVDDSDLELLSDEERVEYLLERNGGRMKQANIVKETGWSNAKVSQLLSAMEEQDRIDKLRIGRENLISLPGEGVADIDYDARE